MSPYVSRKPLAFVVRNDRKEYSALRMIDEHVPPVSPVLLAGDNRDQVVLSPRLELPHGGWSLRRSWESRRRPVRGIERDVLDARNVERISRADAHVQGRAPKTAHEHGRAVVVVESAPRVDERYVDYAGVSVAPDARRIRHGLLEALVRMPYRDVPQRRATPQLHGRVLHEVGVAASERHAENGRPVRRPVGGG